MKPAKVFHSVFFMLNPKPISKSILVPYISSIVSILGHVLG